MLFGWQGLDAHLIRESTIGRRRTLHNPHPTPLEFPTAAAAVVAAPCSTSRSASSLTSSSPHQLLPHPNSPLSTASSPPHQLLPHPHSPLSTAPAPATSPLPSLHRTSSAAAPTACLNPSSFAVEEYLVSTCSLTRAQAPKASAKLSHLKSPAKPDAVLAFLAGLGHSGTDVAALVAKDPQFLCAGVERTLAPVVADLTGLGLSPFDIARLVSLAPGNIRNRSVVSKIDYYLSLLGSIDNLLWPIKYGSGFLDSDLGWAVKPYVKLLAECGLGACDIAKLFIREPWMLSTKPERLLEMVASSEGIGVPRGSGMFRQALHAVSWFSEDKITAKVDYLKKTFRWSDTEVGIAVSKGPSLLRKSKDMLKRRSEFLISEVRLEPAYIVHRPAMLTYSLEGRLRPCYYVVKFLKENGLLNHDRDYYAVVSISEKPSVEKFICPHKQAAPHLAEDYAAACKGEVPARFRFT